MAAKNSLRLFFILYHAQDAVTRQKVWKFCGNFSCPLLFPLPAFPALPFLLPGCAPAARGKTSFAPLGAPGQKNIDFEPLTTGLYINTLLDRDFWVQSPDKYPKGYYFFSTRVRTHIFLGERVTFKFNNPGRWHKSVTLFYELSSCDLYILNKFGNKYLKPKDYLSLSFGLKFQILW